MSIALLAIVALLRACMLLQPAAGDGLPSRAADLPTVAEKSDFKATSRYDEVNAFLKDLAAKSSLVRTWDIGKSGEGRAIPLMLLADPPVASVEEAKKSGKMVVLMVGGIHSGECDGKEALLALARDVALAREESKRQRDEETKRQRDKETKREEKKDGSESGAAAGGEKGHGDEKGVHDAVSSSLGLSVSSSLSSSLDHLILAFVPIYNPDGNEKMDPKNRPGQVGPETMGIRENALPPAGLDLNRDFVKLEAPETRALVRLMNQLDPAVVVDTHTTNGSFHRYTLTYDTNKNPAGDAKLLEYCRGALMPALGKAVKDSSGIDTFWYGNFERDHGRWETYPDQPRYGINYVGMRNRIGILTESYSYATYKERIGAQEAFLKATIAYAAGHREEIRKLISETDARISAGGERERGPTGEGRRRGGRRGERPAGGEPARADAAKPDGGKPETAPAEPELATVAIRSKMVASEGKTKVLGYVEEEKDGHNRPTKEAKDYDVDLYVSFAPEKTVPRPYAYIIAAPDKDDTSFATVIQTLQRHGIKIEETREDIELDTSAAAIDAVTKAVRPFQGHSTVSVQASRHEVPHRFPAGSMLIKTAQPLGNLAAYLLEPESSDGLATWNFLDRSLVIGQDFPIYRLEKPVPITTIAAAALPEEHEAPKPITFEEVFESDHAPNFNGSPVGGISWLEDGEHFLQVKDGRLYKVGAGTGKAEPAFDWKPIAAALEKLPTIDRRTADGIARRTGQRWTKDRSAFVFDHQNDLYYCKTDGSQAVRLTSSPQREELWSLSPDGQFVAFVRDNDLWVVDVATQKERALTTGATETLRRGKADWVYYEEVFNRREQVYWWSPDSTRIAFYEIDSSPIKPYTIVNDIPEGQNVERTLYPKVGGANPIARMKTVQVAGGEPREIDLSAYTPQDMLILNAEWSPDSSRVVFYVSNRTQTFADVLAGPADGGSPTKLFRETTKAWIDSPPAPKFLKDGTFLFTSERSGYKHLYHYAADGKLMHETTGGPWECRSIAQLDEEHGWVYVMGTKDDPIAENLYRVRVDGSGLERLTMESGSHRCDVSAKGGLFVDSWSSAERPARVALRKVEGGEIVRTLDTNPVRDLERYILTKIEMVHIPTPDGFVMEGSILKPADFDPAKKYPVWFMTYGGPQAPTVFNSWSARGFDHVLAHMGFVVFRADPRAASGKGAVFAWPIYKQLGIHELEDVETAIKWLSKNPWVDASRIGMSGFSYGGFMTSFCMTHSKLFAAGIAGGPVTDWRDYDSVYTERYMLTPQENPDGYEKTSVVKAAKDLHGRLMVVHGFIDDNVHLQNSERLIRALQGANKQFEMMLYPEARHGIGARHFQRLQIDFIQRTLGTPARTEGSSESAAAR